MSCQLVYESDLIERYVRGEGTRGEREAFERHYFECQACYEKVRACRLLRAELRPDDAAGAGRPRRDRFGRRGAWSAALAAGLVAVAAGIALWSQRQRVSLPPPAPVAVEPEAAPPRAGGPVVALAELARVEPPPYEELRLRGPADDATRAFREAMARYAAADYAGAARGLERAAQLDPQAPDPPFYLGICRLMLGDAPAAVRDLQRAVRISDPASADEARFYLAKAYLAQDDLEAARRELRRVVDGGREHSADARRILAELDRIDAVGR